MMVETQPVGVETTNQVVQDDMETKVVNAVIAAMKQMGVLGPVTAPQPAMMAMPGVQQGVAPALAMSGIPRIDRSRQRMGRASGVAAGVVPMLAGSSNAGYKQAVINKMQVAPVGATSAGMMVTMPVQL